MKAQHLLIAAAIFGLIIWLFRKKGAASTSSNEEKLLFSADWSAKKFHVSHPKMGRHTITNPQLAQEGAANHLANNSYGDLYWNLVPGNRFVVTLVHDNGPIFSEAYIVDLTTDEAQYHQELQQATVTA